MVELLANITQVINNSPQVGSMVGGQMAAEEMARQRGQEVESKRQQMELKKKVLALEMANKYDPTTDPDGKQRQETRRERKSRLKAEREGRQAAERRARAARAAKSETAENGGCAASPFDPEPVIDVCV